MKGPAIIIPSLDPDEKTVGFIRALRCRIDWPLIVVNDGSRPECSACFEELRKIPDCTILTHAVNLGKGRALKTAFNYCLQRWPDGCGAVTADDDGQHLPEDIVKCGYALLADQESLILGIRDFSGKTVPWKSLFGNHLTMFVLSLMLGCRIRDTQTGLRGIPVPLMKILMHTSGERFEYETKMLLDSSLAGFRFHQVPVETIYPDGNRRTHFRPVCDSLKIYGVIFRHLFPADHRLCSDGRGQDAP